jgi:hypothetical protein
MHTEPACSVLPANTLSFVMSPKTLELLWRVKQLRSSYCTSRVTALQELLGDHTPLFVQDAVVNTLLAEGVATLPLALDFALLKLKQS